MKGFQSKIFAITFLAAYLFYQFATLSVSPLPWLDETYMASITDSLIKNNTLHISYAPFLPQDAALLYGPVYFYLQKGLLSCIGFGIIQFRLLNLLCGIGCVIALYTWLQKRFTPSLLFFIIACILLEPTFIRNLHSGRMDFVALFFLIAAYIFYFNHLNKFKPVWKFIIVGLLLALSVLTTPRMLFGLSFFIVEFFLHLQQRNRIKIMLTIAATFSCICLLWVFLGFAGFTAYLNLYIDNSIIKEHIGTDKGIIFRYNYLIPLTLIVISSAIFLFRNRLELNEFERLLFRLCSINIITFHTLIAERGPYTALIIPFYCMLFGLALKVWCQKSYGKKIATAIKWAGLVPFLLIFCAKAIVLSISFKSRSHAAITQQLAQVIPAKSKVIGCYDYYYACYGNGNPFEEMEYCTDSSTMYHHQQDVFKYEYIAVRDNFKDNKYLMHYLNASPHLLVANIGSNRSLSQLEEKIDAISMLFFDAHLLSSYKGMVYKKIQP